MIMVDNINDRLALLEHALSEITEGNYTEEIKEELKTWREYADNFINIIPSKDISFKTRSRLDKILDRLELSSQDRRDLEKYIIFGGGENIEYIKNSLEIFLKYKDKLLNIIEKAPEEFDSLIEIFDYIEQHIKESNTKFEEINNNILKVNENNPFEKGSGENSAVLKGGNNQVISENSVALGKDNFVGLKGWYYKALRFNKTNNLLYVFFSNKQVIPTVGQPSDIEKINMSPFELGDIVSVVNDVKYDNQFKINVIHSQYLILEPISGKLPFTEIKTELSLDPEDYSIYILSKPNLGMFDIGQSSFATGYNNKATNGKSTSFGFNNHSWGKFSFTEGRDNEAGYAAHAEGRETKAKGNHSHSEGHQTQALGINAHVEGSDSIAQSDNSHVEGKNNYAGDTDRAVPTASNTTAGTGYAAHVEGQANTVTGNSAHAEGLKNKASGTGSHVEGGACEANGLYSHSEGYHTITKNQGEHAEGKYNVSNNTTIHSVGIGTNTKRKNAHEIMQDGKHYIHNIGGYDGTNPNESDDLATVINNKAEKTDIVQADWNQNNRTKNDFIKNKPFGPTFVDFENTYTYDLIQNWKTFASSESEEVYIICAHNGDSEIVKLKDSYITNVKIGETVFQFQRNSGNIKVKSSSSFEGTVYVGMIEIFYVKPMPECYIPSTIARQSEITRLETRIAELKDIISQITIEVE